jgi:hypothetical protein
MGNTGGGKGFICSPTFHCYCPSWSASKKERKKLARKKDARKRRQQQAELRPYRGQQEKKQNKEERKKTLHANHLAWFMEPPSRKNYYSPTLSKCPADTSINLRISRVLGTAAHDTRRQIETRLFFPFEIYPRRHGRNGSCRTTIAKRFDNWATAGPQKSKCV